MDTPRPHPPGDTARYCPTEMLASFTLLMAGHGRCVSTDMMLGDRDYALSQLSLARGLADGDLRALVQRLFDYFEPPGVIPASAGMTDTF